VERGHKRLSRTAERRRAGTMPLGRECRDRAEQESEWDRGNRAVKTETEGC
jgi:hypothetical protein